MSHGAPAFVGRVYKHIFHYSLLNYPWASAPPVLVQKKMAGR